MNSAAVTRGIEKTIPVLMGIFLFFNPFPHTTSIKEVSFYSSAALALGLWFTRKRTLNLNTPMLKPFVLFLLWIVFTFFFAVDRGNTAHDIYSHYIRYLFWYYLLVCFFDSHRSLEWISWIVVISSVIFIAGAICYFYLYLGNPWSARLASGDYDKMVQTPIHVVGYIAMFAMMLSLHHFFDYDARPVKWLSSLHVLILFSAILLTQSRGLLLAVTLSVVTFLLIRSNRRTALLVAGIIVLAILLTPVRNRVFSAHSLHNDRQKMFYNLKAVIKDYPFTGIGYGMQSYASLDLDAYRKKLPDASKRYEVGDPPQLFIADPHNWIIGLTVRIGFFGMLLHCYILFTFFQMTQTVLAAPASGQIGRWGSCIAVCMLGFVVIGLSQPTFLHMPEVILYTLYAMMTVIWRLNHGREPQSRNG